MIVLLQIVLYCLLFFLLVKGAARNNGLTCGSRTYCADGKNRITKQ